MLQSLLHMNVNALLWALLALWAVRIFRSQGSLIHPLSLFFIVLFTANIFNEIFNTYSDTNPEVKNQKIQCCKRGIRIGSLFAAFLFILFALAFALSGLPS